jgi:hypothetical protein
VSPDSEFKLPCWYKKERRRKTTSKRAIDMLLISSILLAFYLSGGSMYLLGIWSGQLKTLLGLSQTEVNIITNALFFGGCIATPLVCISAS